jgi:hypothetical protein
MEVITCADIEKFQLTLENEVKNKIINDNVEQLYKNFMYNFKNVKIQDKTVKSSLNANTSFKMEGKKFTFEREQIMPGVQRQLEALFPDCHVAYQFNPTNNYVEVTLLW